MARDEIDLRSLTLEELEKLIINIGEPKFRAKQIFGWLNKNFVNSFDDMTNVSKNLRGILSEISYLSTCTIVNKLESKEATRDDVRKKETHSEQTLERN